MSEILRVEEIHTYYRKSYVIQGLSLSVAAGTVAALLGKNGMGKTTTIRSIMGFSSLARGKIYFKGKDISTLPPYSRCRMGMSIVPQGRRIFRTLTVAQNLFVAEYQDRRKPLWTRERIFSLFPILKERIHHLGYQLSGGEQQMLAIARALISNPDLLLMDEPSEGLAPLMIEQVGLVIEQLKGEGLSILLAEQNIPMVLKLANYAYVINRGIVTFQGTPCNLDEKSMEEYLSI